MVRRALGLVPRDVFVPKGRSGRTGANRQVPPAVLLIPCGTVHPKRATFHPAPASGSALATSVQQCSEEAAGPAASFLIAQRRLLVRHTTEAAGKPADPVGPRVSPDAGRLPICPPPALRTVNIPLVCRLHRVLSRI